MASLDTNKVTGVSTAINATDAIYKEYVDNLSGGSGLPSTTGNSGKFLSVRSGSPSYSQWQSINSTSSSNTDPTYKGYQEFTTAGAQTFYIPPTASQFYIEAIGAGGGGSTPISNTRSAGGGGGAYNSWLIRRSEFGNATTLTVTPGTGGTGGITASSGGNTIVTWNRIAPTGTETYTLTSNGGTGANGAIAGTGGAAASLTLNPLYTTAGLSGASGATVVYPNVTLPGNNTIQSTAFQPTGGASGAYNTTTGGNSSTYLYGSLYTSSGGTASGTAGDNGIPGSFTGSYGSGGAGGGAISTGLNSWYLRTSGFGTTSIATLAYGNGLFVTGGSDITITWVLRTSGFGVTCTTSLYANNLYIIGGSSGRISVSTDTISWTLRTSGTTSQIGSLFGGNGLIYSGSLYVSTGLNPFIATSTDSIVWTLRTTGSSVDIRGVAYGTQPTGTYIIAGTSGTIRTSTDAISWTLRTTGFGANNSGSCIYNDSTTEKYIIGAGAGLLKTSTDAIVWTLRTSGFGSTYISSLVYGTVFVAGSESGSVINSSTDAIVWTLRTLGFSVTGMWGLAYNNGLYVLGTQNSATITSTDAIVWIIRTSNTGQTIQTVNAGNNIWLFGKNDGGINTSTQSTLSSLGNGGLITASTDSITWSLRTSSNIQAITRSTASDSYYLAGGTDYISQPALIASTDSVTWILRTSGFGTSTISALGYGNGEFLASITLPIPITWTLRTSGFGTSSITTVVYGGTSFIASGVSGTLTSSTDGVSWSLRTSGFGTTNINISTYFNNEYLIGGNASLKNAWTLRTTGVTSLFRTVTYGNGVYVASGGGATSMIVSSTDSVTWSLRTSSNDNINISSTYGSLYLIGSAQNNTQSTIISASTDTITWRLRTVGHIDGTKSLTYQNSLYFNFSSRGTTFNFTNENSWSSSVDDNVADRYDHDGKEFIKAFGNFFFITAGDNPYVWIIRTTGVTTSNINSVACAPNGPYVVAGGDLTSGGHIRSSTDSITWFARTSRISGYSANHAVYYNGIFAVSSLYGLQTGTGALVVTSTNSIVWIVRTAFVPFSYSTDILCAANGFWIGVFQQLSYSTDGIVWRIRTVPNIRGNSTSEYRRGVAYGNSVYVNVGGNASATDLSSSTDSIHWVLRTCPKVYLGYSTNAITFGNNIFVVSGYESSNSTVNIATSTNGIHWFLRTSATPYSESTNDAKGYGNGVFIKGKDLLISKNNTLSVSTDSISWEIRTTGIQSQIQTLVYGNSIYVAGGTGGTIVASTDNINWVIRTQPISYNFETSLYDGTNYIMGGSGGSIVVSTDSINWSLRTNPLSSFSSNAILDITYDNVNALYTASSPGKIAISTNSIVWTLRTSSQQNLSYLKKNRVIFGNSVYVEAADSGVISTISYDELLDYQPGGAFLRASTDSVSWVTRTTPKNMTSIEKFGSGGGYSFGTQSGSLIVSTDNITWILRTSGFGSTSGADFTYGNNLYVMSGYNKLLSVSTDTITWVLRTTGGDNNTTYLTFGNNLYVAAGGVVLTSTDTITWTLRTNGILTSSGVIYDADYYDGIYHLVNAFGRHTISTDGIMWISRTTGFGTSAINSISGNGNIWVISGNNIIATSTQTLLSSFGTGSFLSASTDTISWSIRTTAGNDININSIGSGGSYSLACIINSLGEYGIIASTDNIIWQIREAGLGALAINSFAYGTFYVAAGQLGIIRTSTDSIVWTSRTSGFGTSSITSLAYSDVGYIAAGINGSVRTSTNGIVWVVRTGGFGTTSINSVAFGGSVYVITGDSGTVSSASTITQSVAGAGGAGTRGGGGGGGGYSMETNTAGIGGNGGDGYVKITWW